MILEYSSFFIDRSSGWLIGIICWNKFFFGGEGWKFYFKYYVEKEVGCFRFFSVFSWKGIVLDWFFLDEEFYFLRLIVNVGCSVMIFFGFFCILDMFILGDFWIRKLV